jgi:hypothetical protein
MKPPKERERGADEAKVTLKPEEKGGVESLLSLMGEDCMRY